MKTNRMYDEFAYLWPLISSPIDYEREAGFWLNILREKLGAGRKSLLELGVGGGNNLSHLTDDFKATAVDISPGMLKNSTMLNPGVEHIVGDMRTIRVGRMFDAVIVHDAVSYMLNEQDLSQTFQTAREHLQIGGIFVTAPDWLIENFPGIYTSSSTSSDGDTELTYFEYSHDPDIFDTTMETYFTYFIKEGSRFRVEQDRHVTGLFPMKTWTSLMEKTGFEVETRDYPVHDDLRQSNLFVGTYLGR